MDIAITGASGLIGTALSASLTSQGHRPIALVRRAAKAGADEIQWDPAGGTIDAASLEGIDAVVHLAGAGIGDKRWTDDRKKVIRDSRTAGTSVLATALAGLSAKPSVFVSGSGIGYYGSQGDSVLTEADPAGTGFLADVCVEWEAATAPASDAGIRTALARTSVVMSDQGGTLKKQLLLFKLGLGGRFGPGTQWLSWISLTDEVRALEFMITNDIAGPVNLCAPNPVTNLEFTKALGSVLKRPTLVPVPLFGPKLLFGSELVEQLILASQKGMPSVLTNAGFTFENPELEPTLHRLLKK
ncbi:TIGR01777 family oxidoreductase [Acidimicrobiaceae bacterium]|nr:TIGR01777 family oxidoreductase [Acidimicrobiaceae bacterium]